MKITLDTNEITRDDFELILEILYAGDTPTRKLPADKTAAVEASAEKVTKDNKKIRKAAKSEGPTIEDLRAQVSKKVEEHRDAIRAELKKLDAKNVSSLDAEHYEAFDTFLTKL